MKNTFHSIYSGINLIKHALLGKENNFTTGKINRSIVLLSVPMVAELFMESLFVCVNLFFVSKLGAKAISIAGATTSIITLCYSVAVGLSIGASAVVSRRIGEKNYKEAGLTAMQAIYLTLPLALILSSVCSIWAPDILHIIGLSSAMIEEGFLYARIMFASSGFLILRIVINGILRGAGDASAAMQTQWISNVLNIALCPLLIFGWGFVPAYGLLGIGMAGAISRMVAVAYQVWYLSKGKTIMIIGREQLIFHLSIFKKISKLAFGGTLQFVIPASSWVFMIKIISFFGENALAGYILAQRLSSIATMPAWGIGNAAGILTGQNLGANQPDRAEKTVWRAGILNMGFLIIIAVFWYFFASPVVKMFSNSLEIIVHSISYIQFISVAYILLGFTMVISKSLNASGQVMVVTLLYILMFYVIQIPFSYLLGIYFNLGPNGVFTAILVSEVILSIACILVFRKGKWKKIKI